MRYEDYVRFRVLSRALKHIIKRAEELGDDELADKALELFNYVSHILYKNNSGVTKPINCS